MKIDEKVTITLNEDNVRELVKKEVEKQGYGVLEINFNIKNEKWTTGYGMLETDHEKIIFHGVEIKAKKL